MSNDYTVFCLRGTIASIASDIVSKFSLNRVDKIN